VDLRHRTRKNLAFGLTLLVIVLAGAALRLYDLGGHSVDLDESATWDVIRQPTLGAMLDSVAGYGQAPFSFVVTYAITQALGESEIPLRLSSALAGILAIPAVYLVGRRLFGYAEGLIGAGLTAALWQPLYYSQYARAYSWSLFLSALAVYYWLGLLADVRAGRPMQRRSAALYVLFGLAAIYNHYLAALMQAWQAPALLAAVLAERGDLRQRAKEWAGVYLAYGLGFLPWLPQFIGQTQRTGLHSWIREPSPSAFNDFVNWSFSGFSGWYRTPPLTLQLGVGLALLALAMALGRGLARWRQGRRGPLWGNGEFLLLLWIVVPMGLLFAVSLNIKPLWVNRYLIFVIPALGLLAARGLGGLPWPRRYPRLAGQALLSLAGAALVGTFGWHSLVGRDFYGRGGEYAREVAGVIEAFRGFAPDAVSAFCGYRSEYDYYSVRLGRPSMLDIEVCRDRDVERLEARLAESGTHFFILSELHKRVSEETLAQLEALYCLVDKAQFGRSGVWLFTAKDDDACPTN
jgi:4-amino-4-deoxy-L-arabinose transferase-like glycosyltransferase